MPNKKSDVKAKTEFVKLLQERGFDAAAYAANMAGTPIFAIGKAGDIYNNYLGDPVQSWGPKENNLKSLQKYSEETLEWLH